jgi:hypothetical protein
MLLLNGVTANPTLKDLLQHPYLQERNAHFLNSAGRVISEGTKSICVLQNEFAVVNLCEVGTQV